MSTSYGPPVEYAGFWVRVAANIVDSAIIVIIGLVLAIGASFAGEMAILIANVVYILINLLYWPVMESSARQATFGKSLVGIQVTDLNGKRQSFLRAFLRNLAKIISAIPLGIGFLLAAFTGRKQALHDMITKSLVVRTGPSHFIKAFAAAAGALLIAAGGGGAYFYYVIKPQAQNEFGDEMQEAMTSAVNPAPARPPAPVVVAPAPAAPVPSVPVPAPQPAPVVTPPAAPQPVAVVAPEPVAEPAKPAKKPRKTAKRKPATKPVVEKMAEPVPKPDNEPVAPAESVEVVPMAPAVVPRQAPADSFVPEETRIIRPKYNDLMTAVLRSDQEAVKQLLDLGWWVDKPGPDGYTPLVAAVMNRDAQMVRLLLDRGAVPSSQALKIARDKKDAETTSLLEQRGAR